MKNFNLISKTDIIKDINRLRPAQLHEIMPFYKELGIDYVNKFNSKEELMIYFDNDVKNGEKVKFALVYYQRIDEQNSLRLSLNGGDKMGHIVALKYDKTDGRNSFRIIDFQKPKENEKRMIKNDLPINAIPPFYLFKKQVYR